MNRLMELGRMRLDGEAVQLEIGRFPEKPNCLILFARCEDGTPYSKLTVNVEVYPPLPEAGLVMRPNDWGDRWEKVRTQLLDTGWVSDTGIGIEQGYNTYPVWRLTEAGILRLLLMDAGFVYELLPSVAGAFHEDFTLFQDEVNGPGPMKPEDILARIILAATPHVGEA